MVRKNVKAVKDVIENESHLIPEIVNNNLGSLAMLTKHFMSGNGGRGGSIAGRGGGSLAKRSMESNDVLGGGGFVVVGGRSSRVGAGGGEVMGGGDDFGVSRSFLGEMPGEIMGEKVGEECGGEEFGVDGGAVFSGTSQRVALQTSLNLSASDEVFKLSSLLQ
ncbi:hypothetical protein Tco_0104368 [Tanacetum coccineum]